MHIFQHITIGSVGHCICVMHETCITISCMSCIPVPVTCRPDTLMLVVIVVACIPAEASCQMQSAILIATTSGIDPSYPGRLHIMMGLDIIDPSGSWPLGIIPSSPHPLDPSGPQSLFLILTTRLRYIITFWEGPCNRKW